MAARNSLEAEEQTLCALSTRSSASVVLVPRRLHRGLQDESRSLDIGSLREKFSLALACPISRSLPLALVFASGSRSSRCLPEPIVSWGGEPFSHFPPPCRVRHLGSAPLASWPRHLGLGIFGTLNLPPPPKPSRPISAFWIRSW